MIGAAQPNAHRHPEASLSAQDVAANNLSAVRPPHSGSRLAINNRPDRTLRDDVRRAHPFLVAAVSGR